MKKSIVVISIVAVGIIGAVMFLVAGNSDREGMLKILPDEADLRVKDFHYTEVGDSDVVWEINAEKAEYSRKETEASFVNVRVKLITSDGRIYFMTGDEGRLNTETKDIAVSGNVIVTSSNKDRFESDDIHYTYRDKKIYTEGPVVANNESLHVRGRGLLLFIKEKRLVLLSSVEATVLNWRN